MTQWIQDNLAIPLLMGIGAIGMKLFDSFLNRRKAKKELSAQDIENRKNSIDNYEKLNNLLSKQLETNVQRYLDIMNINISLKGENASLREQLQEMKCELKALKKSVSEYEIEIMKLKEYIKKETAK